MFTRGIVATLVAIGALTGCGNSSDSGSVDEGTQISKAAKVCEVGTEQFSDAKVRVADEGRTLIGDGVKEADFADLICMFLELDTPDAIVTQMDNTSAMMGTQEADDDNLHYRWSYHPDSGMNVVVTED